MDAGVAVKLERRRMLDTWKSEGIYSLRGEEMFQHHTQSYTNQGYY